MEQIITLKVDLEHPDDAKFAIDAAAEAYEADKLKWTAEELAEAKRLAMKIMTQLCLDGYSISWSNTGKSLGYISIYVLVISEDDKDSDCACTISQSKWNIWIAKASVCAVLPAGMCLRSSPKRLVSAGDGISQSAKPQAQTKACNGCWRVQKRCQQGAVDGEIHQPVL